MTFEEAITLVNQLSDIELESHEFIRLDPKLVTDIESHFIDIVNQEVPLYGKKLTIDNFHRQGIIGRYLSDMPEKPENDNLKKFYSLICRIDDEFKLWNQFYFTLHFKDLEIKRLQYERTNEPIIQKITRKYKLEKILN